jgi:hypothetical protein
MNPMNKTLILTMLAFACVATTMIPTASACYSNNPVVQYAYCGSGALHDGEDAAAFAAEEAAEAVAFVQGTEAWGLLP